MPIDHAKLTELFTEAMDLGEPERAALVSRVRTQDPELAAELVAMLSADESIVTALRTAGLKPDDVGDTFRKPTIPVGQLGIPGFKMKGVVGKGGMGVVYAGEQIEPRRPVALKVLHMAAPEALARFAIEAQVMMGLDHPGIARVYASGEANGHPYIAMEMIEGLTLDAYVRQKQPSLAQRLELFAQICDAVQYAHERGVIHRDLKPSNIMVRSTGSIAIFDFGVARADGSNRTQQGDFLGTLMYMSPEQATGRTKEIDARTDMYALGVILFELVKGSMPYDLTGMHTAQAVRTIVGTPPRPLGSPDRELDAICAQALSKQKAQRQASAAELAQQIRGVIATLP